MKIEQKEVQKPSCNLKVSKLQTDFSLFLK